MTMAYLGEIKSEWLAAAAGFSVRKEQINSWEGRLREIREGSAWEHKASGTSFWATGSQ